MRIRQLRIILLPGVDLTISLAPNLINPPDTEPSHIVSAGVILDSWSCDNDECPYEMHRGLGLCLVVVTHELRFFLSWGVSC